MPARLIGFHAGGRLGVVGEDGGGERFLDPGVPGQQSWQFGPALPDGGILLHSFEDTTMSRVVVGDVQVNLWRCGLHDGSLEPLEVADRPAPYFTCCAALADGRLLGSAMVEGEQRLYLVEADGSGCRAITHPGQGFHYGVGLSPDQGRLACHVTGDKYGKYPRVYSYTIEVIEIAGGGRTMVAARTGHLYFGPVWSAAGDRLAYLDCHADTDHAHFAADLCVGHADGTAHRVVAGGQPHWFGTSYGADGHRGGGSNMTSWIPGTNRITWTRLLPDSHADARYDASRPDHEELVYAPKLARGGTQLCALDPDSGGVAEITAAEEGRWDFHASWSGAGDAVVFSRARVTEPPELWIAAADGSGARRLSAGHDRRGAGFGRWLTG